MTTTDDYQLLMTTEQCAPAIEVTHHMDPMDQSLVATAAMNFLLM